MSAFCPRVSYDSHNNSINLPVFATVCSLSRTDWSVTFWYEFQVWKCQ